MTNTKDTDIETPIYINVVSDPFCSRELLGNRATIYLSLGLHDKAPYKCPYLSEGN